MGVCRWNGGGCDEMRDIFHRDTKLSSKGEFNF